MCKEVNGVNAVLNHHGKDDLKSIKTKNALYAALSFLLENYSFEKITVRNICEEALISRAAFYAHFGDKYNLLLYWLMTLTADIVVPGNTYERTAHLINTIVNDNKKIIRNLIRDARKETLDVLLELILTTLDFSGTGKKEDERHTVLSSFYAGGILHYLLWQVEHKFPQDIRPMNEHLYELMKHIQTLSDKGGIGYEQNN